MPRAADSLQEYIEERARLHARLVQLLSQLKTSASPACLLQLVSALLATLPHTTASTGDYSTMAHAYILMPNSHVKPLSIPIGRFSLACIDHQNYQYHLFCLCALGSIRHNVYKPLIASLWPPFVASQEGCTRRCSGLACEMY